MATLTIRNLDERTKAQLRVQAARHGRSMEEEARTILRTAIESSQARAYHGRRCERLRKRDLDAVGARRPKLAVGNLPGIPSGPIQSGAEDRRRQLLR